MNTVQLFQEHKEALVQEWINYVVSSYPLDTTGFLRTKKDQFCNPVGEIITTVAGHLYDAATGRDLPEDFTLALERFVKLRSVQEFTPAQALGVIFVYKEILRKTLWPIMAQKSKVDEYLNMEWRIDSLGLMAFDIYVQSREDLAEQRIKEIRNQHSQLVRYAQRRGITPETFAEKNLEKNTE